MSNNVTTNVLLSVIAACLVLVVVKIYGMDDVRDAHAASSGSALVQGCYEPRTAIVAAEFRCRPMDIRVDINGFLILSDKKPNSQ